MSGGRESLWGEAPRVIISNGFKNFHMSSAAAEADRRGTLIALFSGLYPKRWIRSILRFSRLDRLTKAGKLIGRGVEVNERRVQMFFVAEFLNHVGLLACRFRWTNDAGLKLAVFSMKKFADSAAKWLRRSPSRFEIYHYRAGFGGPSLIAAQRRGAVLLCDHSIAHPLVLSSLVTEGGVLKELNDCVTIEPMWQLVLRDIEQATHVVVNSDFVKRTFEYIDFPLEKVSVIYLGVDDTFFRSIPPRRAARSGEPLRFLFAGSFGDRKGANVLLEAISRLPAAGWALFLAGTIEKHLESAVRQAELRFPVQHLGNLTREQLAQEMSRADVFVFPSLAEGSARVVFEAMACGCYIITTPNAGSVVEDGVHGQIVPPGDANALARSMAAVIDDCSVAVIGKSNAALVSENFRQHSYGEKVAALYKSLTESQACK